MTSDEARPKRLLSTAALLKRYDLSSQQTLRTWHKKFGFPDPSVVVNRRVHYWDEVVVEEWERTRTAAGTEAA